MPDWGMLKELVERAAADVALAEANISKQRAVIAMLQRQGHDTTAARELLAQLLKTFETLEMSGTASAERLTISSDGWCSRLRRCSCRLPCESGGD
jgi:hypothetical protein